MPDVYGPFTSATWGQAPWFRALGPLLWSGVNGLPGATPSLGDLGLTTNGLQLSLGLGRAMVRGAGYERTGSAWTYTVPANTNATLARIDRVVLRRDLVAQTVVPAVLQGTPNATPSAGAVALTQVEDGTWEEWLHDVTVPAASGTVLTVADWRNFLPMPGPAGRVEPTWSNVAVEQFSNGGYNELLRVWKDAPDHVACEGIVSIPNGHSLTPFTLFTLPVGFRPGTQVVRHAAGSLSSSSAANDPYRLNVLPTGVVQAVPAATKTGQQYISLQCGWRTRNP